MRREAYAGQRILTRICFSLLCAPGAFCRRPVFALWIVLLASPAIAQEPILWGRLKPGPYAVGFRALYQLDLARQYDPEYVADPNHPPAARPRPILVCLWYPAQRTQAEPIAYRQYLEISSSDPAAASFAKRLMPYIRDVVCEETIGKNLESLSAGEAAAFERFLKLKTFAVKDAPAANGRFPLVIYHPGLGGSYEDNSVLFEYLASHGYAVVSSAYPMASATKLNIDWDLKRSFRDMEFLARHAGNLPFVDGGCIADMGHSYGAQAALAWCAEPSSALRAAVSIDSTVENVGIDYAGFAPLKKHFDANKLKPRTPTIRFASRENKPKFDTLERYLKFVPRYEATVASLEHNDYLTHGAIRPALMPDKFPDRKKAQALRTSYDRVCEHILNFLDATLKQKAGARQFLQKSLRGEGLDDNFSLAFRSPAPAPPTARQLAYVIQHQGLDRAIELIRACRDDIEVGGDGIGGAGNILVDNGQAKEALALYTRAGEIFPKSLPILTNLGDALARSGERKEAIAKYRKCLDLLAADPAEEWLKKRWKQDLERKLEKLASPKGE